jgi:four helix bundle protein
MINEKSTVYELFSNKIYPQIADLGGKYEVDLSKRLFHFAVNIIRFIGSISHLKEYEVFRIQLSRCGTSMGANFEEACASLSRKEFISKLSICLKESRETNYWLRILVKLNLGDEKSRSNLEKESLELIKIFMASIKTAKKNL